MSAITGRHAAEITRILELAAGRQRDLTVLVYARLFADHPEMEALFVRDTEGLVKAEMLARVFETILDFIDRRAYAPQLIQCEVVTHEGYGVPPEVFGIFFETVALAIREILGDEWSASADASWRRLLADLDRYVKNPEQFMPPPSVGRSPVRPNRGNRVRPHPEA
jgi:hemoglobin-like flavoprotein